MKLSVLAACLAVVAAAPALANGRLSPVTNETVRSECGDCHLAYPPQLLPQRSWRKLLDGLLDHFGEEIELDQETRDAVSRYLLANAADKSPERAARKFLRGLGPGMAPTRITETPRWVEKHRELPESTWSDERIGFKGHCEACHTEAERGLYDDDAGLRVPGPNGTWRRWEDD